MARTPWRPRALRRSNASGATSAGGLRRRADRFRTRRRRLVLARPHGRVRRPGRQVLARREGGYGEIAEAGSTPQMVKPDAATVAEAGPEAAADPREPATTKSGSAASVERRQRRFDRKHQTHRSRRDRAEGRARRSRSTPRTCPGIRMRWSTIWRTSRTTAYRWAAQSRGASSPARHPPVRPASPRRYAAPARPATSTPDRFRRHAPGAHFTIRPVGSASTAPRSDRSDQRVGHFAALGPPGAPRPPGQSGPTCRRPARPRPERPAPAGAPAPRPSRPARPPRPSRPARPRPPASPGAAGPARRAK